MRDPARIDPLLQEISETWKLYPDFRLGQLLTNAARTDDSELWHVEDDVWLTRIRAYRKSLEEGLLRAT